MCANATEYGGSGRNVNGASLTQLIYASRAGVKLLSRRVWRSLLMALLNDEFASKHVNVPVCSEFLGYFH